MSKQHRNSVTDINSPSIAEERQVLMFIGRQCAYCLPMMLSLSELMKAGHIAELRILSIEDNAELAAHHGVRSVPWLQLGPFELTGSRSKQELLLWLQRASTFEGMTAYLEELLLEGNLQLATRLIQRHPQSIKNVITLMADADAKMNVRLGVGVIIEDLAESELFKMAIPSLLDYLSGDDARIRGDACHYLSLTKDVSHIPAIKNLLTDDSEEVREIAQDSLDELLSLGD